MAREVGFEIVSYYRGPPPPIDFEAAIREAAGNTPARYLAGLGSVVIRDLASLTREERRWRYRIGGAKHGKSQAKGLYFEGKQGKGARIEIFTDNVVSEYSANFLRFPMFKHYVASRIFFHELGHHILTHVEPSRGDLETKARRWERWLVSMHLRKKYRSLNWLARILAFFRLGWRRGGREKGKR